MDANLITHPKLVDINNRAGTTENRANMLENITVRLAQNQEEILAAQRLRYEIFFQEMGTNSSSTSAEGIDQDEFDAHCEHLIAIDQRIHEIVGVYRILSPQRAKDCGKRYSQDEFDLSPLTSLYPQMVEVGRSCVHANYRNGAVIAKLWSGLVGYMQAGGYQYLTGCASIPTAFGEAKMAAILQLVSRYLCPEQYRVTPYNPWHSATTWTDEISLASLPPLLKGYLRAGAWVCSNQAAYDQKFKTVDVLILLDMNKVTARHARHFITRKASKN